MTEKKPSRSTSVSINKAYVTYAIFIIFAIIPVIRLITHVYLKGDANVFTGNIDSYRDYFSLWGEDRLGGAQTTRLWILFPIGVIYYMLDALGASPNILQAIYIGISFLVGFLSFSYLAKVFIGIPRHSAASVIASVAYMYNPYVTLIMGGLFQFLIAYSLMPLFFALYIKYTGTKSNLTLLLASLTLSLIFGPNFVFGVVALFLCFLFAIYKSRGKALLLIKDLFSLAKIASLSLLLIAWWLVPLLAIGFLDTSASASVLTSESFYNNDTSIVNVIRSLGDWSFFAKHLGQPYFSYSQVYLSNIFVIIGTFLPLGLLFYLTTLKLNKKNLKSIGFFSFVLLVTFLVVGGTHPDWPTAKLFSYLFDNIQPLLIFRNTYKFAVIILLIFSLITAMVLHVLPKKRKKVASILVAPLLLVGSFPILFNLVMQDQSLIQQIPEYWLSASSDLNERDDVKKVLLLPDQYFSIYEWDDEIANLGGQFEGSLLNAPVVQNTCAGCANTDSANLMERLVQNYSEPTFSNALQLIGVSHVIQRNDYATSFYPSIDSSKKVNDALALADGLSLENSYGALDVYKVNDHLNQVYSPELLVKSPSSDLFNIFQKYKPSENIALIAEETIMPDESFNTYRSIFYNYEDITVTEDGISEKILIDQSQGNTNFALDNPDSLLNLEEGVATFEIQNENGRPVSEVVDTRGANGSRLGSFELSENLVAASDLRENHTFSTGNCRNLSESPELSAITVLDERINEPVIEMEADSDMACISYGVADILPGEEFLIQIDHRVFDGGYFGYCLSFDGQRCNQTEIIDAEDSTWGTYNVIFETDPNESYNKMRVYLYAPAIYGTSSKVRYKLPTVRQVISEPSAVIQTDIAGDVEVTGKFKLGTREFVPDGNFESELWDNGGKSCSQILDSSRYSTRLVEQGDEQVLRLESLNTTACSSSPRFEIENSSAYVLSIDAKVIEGDSWGYCIYSGLSCLSRKFQEVEHNEWQRYYYLFDGLPSEKNLNLYLYTSQSSSESVVEYKNASIKRVLSHQLPKFSSTNKDTKYVDPIEILNTTKLSATKYNLELSMPAKGLGSLVFQQSYSPVWSLTLNGKRLEEQSHYLANSFANAWLIDPVKICEEVECQINYESKVLFSATIEFQPQQYANQALFVSAISHVAVGVLGIGLYGKRKKELRNEE